jgi:guanylate kinase
MIRGSLKSSAKSSLKLKSMPRNKNASAVYIQMHQLANLKQRLKGELQRLGDRTIEIHKQLQELELNLNQLQEEATEYISNDNTPQSSPNSNVQILNTQSPTVQNNKYQNFIIEY